MRPIAIEAARWGLWPLLMLACISVTYLGIQADIGFWAFNAAYLSLAVIVFFIERRLPFERDWLKNDGQIAADLSHTILSKGAVQVMLVVGAIFGLAEQLGNAGQGFWPTHWPIFVQVLLGLVIIEAGLYLAHRLAHEIPLLWRFHAVHHSAPRLSFINTGRFHVVDTVVSIVLSQPLLFLAGAPIEIFKMTSATTAFIGMLTHCNIDLKFGWLAFVFNTPTLHRFHHSRHLEEGNKNYGENLMLFDLLFGTFYNPARRPSCDIGISEYMPRTFLGQLTQPFLPQRDRATNPDEPGMEKLI